MKPFTTAVRIALVAGILGAAVAQPMPDSSQPSYRLPVIYYVNPAPCSEVCSGNIPWFRDDRSFA